MNALLNIKTAEKRLQFGVTKCKSMRVSKNVDTLPSNNLLVDSWEVKYVDDLSTGSNQLVEAYNGVKHIETEISWIYNFK